jgi:hypothetical protein
VIVSSDTDTQDQYVYRLRARRRPAYGTASLQEAAALARTVRPAVIVVDVRTRGDWRACRSFRADPLTRRIPVVAISECAAGEGRDLRLGARIGCAAVVSKASPDVVETVIAHADRTAAG